MKILVICCCIYFLSFLSATAQKKEKYEIMYGGCNWYNTKSDIIGFSPRGELLRKMIIENYIGRCTYIEYSFPALSGKIDGRTYYREDSLYTFFTDGDEITSFFPMKRRVGIASNNYDVDEEFLPWYYSKGEFFFNQNRVFDPILIKKLKSQMTIIWDRTQKSLSKPLIEQMRDEKDICFWLMSRKIYE